jgi:cysteine desulfurase family protein (TIGR01976 family)
MSLDLAFARSQFPALSDETNAWVYLDNAGGSQVLGTVADRVRDYLLTSSVQLGASYGVSALAAERLYAGQSAIAELINADRPEEVVFGPSSTAMIQTLARAIAPKLSPGDEVVVSMIDHEANIGPWLALQAGGILIRPWNLSNETMTLEVDDLEPLMTTRTRLVVCTQTSNIFGQLIPVAPITACARRHGAEVCIDGVAYAPHRLVDVRGWDVDYYVFSLYKVFGPHHAVLYGKYDRLLKLANLSHHFVPMDKIPGKLQPGNPNYELSYGATAIPEYLVALGERSGATADASRRARMQTAFDAIAEHEALLAERLLAWLRQRTDVRIVGPASSDRAIRVPTISFVVDGLDSDAVVRAIDPMKIGIRFGDFYSRRLIEDLGLTAGKGVVRASFAHYNTIADADRLLAGLDQALSSSTRPRSASGN